MSTVFQPRFRLALAAAALSLLAPAHAGATAAADAPATLPDSFVIARVADRPITVYNFRVNYFNSDATLRPKADSLGRVQFLTDLVSKEVLGLSALAINRPFGFEDRAELRDYRRLMLSNRLFALTVNNVEPASEDSLRKVYEFTKRELRLKILYFDNRSQAELVRHQLIGGQLPWSVALQKYGVKSKSVTDGLSGWMRFGALPMNVWLPIWSLRRGEISPVLLASSGYHLVQIAEERPCGTGAYNVVRRVLRAQLRDVETTARKLAIQTEAKRGMDVVYDTTNVRFASKQFHEAVKLDDANLGGGIKVDESVPEFATEDTSRTLVRWNTGRLSLGDLVHAYTDIQPIARPSLNTPENLLAFVDAVFLEPRMVEMAEQRGLDKDPQIVKILNEKRESILVRHMVDDSVLTHIRVTPDERRAYYKAHEQGFITFPTVDFAMFVRGSRAAADSAKARLDAGLPVDSLLAIDRAHHVTGTGTSTLKSNESSDYRKLLFEELRPGKCTVVGPDKDKNYGVLYEIRYNEGHLLPFEQVESLIDESVNNEKGDMAIRALIGRLSKKFRIEQHPELVMRFVLNDPTVQQD